MIPLRTMGLDISTKTGCVVLQAEDIKRKPKMLYEAEWEVPKVRKGETPLRGLARASYLAGRMLEVIAKFEPTLVLIEGYGFANTNSLATLVEVGTVMRFFLLQEEISTYVVTPKELKQYATGNGNASKDKVMMHVFKNWNIEPETNNTADAYVLATMAVGRYGLVKQTKKQIELCMAATPLV